MKNITRAIVGLITAWASLQAGAARALAQSVYSDPYTVNTFAGILRSPGSASGTPGQFAFPFGVATDSAGNVYVGDTDNDTIRIITPAGLVSTLAGQAAVTGSANGSGTAASFDNPEGVAVDSAGNVYVADISNTEIRKITPGGVVTTFAGLAGSSGTADGTGSSARFAGPAGVAADSAGNVYVADTYSDTIRKITPAGVVTTFAGLAGSQGSVDGTGSTVRLNQPSGVAVDSAGNVYVADTYNDTIRKITPAGVSSTLAGLAGSVNSTDGTGSAARFYLPIGVAVDKGGNVYVADTYNQTLRAITPAGVVTTLAGQVGVTGASNGAGAGAQFYLPYGVAVDTAGNVYVADTLNIIVRKAVSFGAPVITSGPQGGSVSAGSTATLSVTATGALGYQWYFGGSVLAGANSPTLVLANVGTSQQGTYTVAVTNGAGTVNSLGAVLTVTYSARLDNLSSRAYVAAGGNILITGFGLAGTGTKHLLLRGVGPGLNTTFGLTGILATPQLTLYDSSAAPGPYPIVTDIGWSNASVLGSSSVGVAPQPATNTLMNTVGAFPLVSGSADCALEVTPPIGSYTSQISGVGSTSGIALAEIYDADTGTPTARLINISARALVGAGGNILIDGFGITGTTSETVLIRGVGPGLNATFGLTGILAQPQLVLLDSVGSGNVIASNSGWGTTPTKGPSTVAAGLQLATAAVMSSVGAFSLVGGSSDAAMVATLPPGNYTAQVSGSGNTTGIALVEVYELP